MEAPRRLALALVLALTACGEAGEPVRGVIHLDPRLADGRSSSAVLAAAVEVRDLQPIARDPASIAPFRVEGGRLGGAPEGVRLIPRRGGAAELVLGPLDASELTTLLLDVDTRRPTTTTVTWTGAAGGESLALQADPRARQPLAFELWRHASWTGAIDELRVRLAPPDVPRVALRRARLIPAGFEWGAEPLEDERIEGPGGGRGDAGLRRAGFESRRAWPADAGVPLFATVDAVPRGAVLALGLAPGGVARHRVERVEAAIDARAPGQPWRRLGWARIEPHSAEWFDVRCDLAPFAGGPVELRFSAWPEEPDGAPDPEAVEALARAEPREEQLLFGAPIVLGELVSDRRPSLVLVTLDTTRADAVQGELVPFFARLAQESLVFEDAWASCNATTPSHATLLSGLHVEEHGTTSNRHALPAEVVTVAEALRAAGYHTMAAVSVPHVQAGVGFGQGFDAFRLHAPGAEVDGEPTLDAALEWLDEGRSLPDRPFFLWVHLFDPHTPYGAPRDFVDDLVREHDLVVPSPTATPPTMPVYADPSEAPPTMTSGWCDGVSSLEHARFLYAVGVAYADRLCERLYRGLEDAGELDDAALIVTADHGEALGEHDTWFGHHALVDETLRVPLYVRLPGGRVAGRVAAPASGVDVAPTLLAIAGVPRPDGLSGVDLVQLARAPVQRPVWFAFSDLHQVGFRDGSTHFVTTLDGKLTLGTRLERRGDDVVPVQGPPIPAGTSFLWDVAADPALERDLAPERPDEVERALARLEAWRAERVRASEQRRELSAEEEARLEALGYAGDE